MATAAKLKPVPVDEPGTDMIAIVMQTPVVVLTDAKQRSSLYAHIEREIEAFVPDVTTNKGREAIKSLAFKVTKTKTAIDAAGKLLNEEARSKINLVDEARRDARNTLDILAERARKPLTDWEEAEAERAHKCQVLLTDIAQAAIVSIDDTAADVRQRGTEVWNTALDPELFGDGLVEAARVKDAAVGTLKAALVRLEREEADRAELEKLRAAEAERVRIEEEKAAAAEVERQRVEADRITAARIEAAQAAQREADARHAEELTAERRRAEEAEAGSARVQHQREWSQTIIQHCRDCSNGIIGGQSQPFGILIRELEEKVTATVEEFGDFAQDVETARREALERVLAVQAEATERREREERETNRAHVSTIMREAKEAIMTCGVSEEIAKAIVVAIKGKLIPNVTIAF